jgi:toxin YoeB
MVPCGADYSRVIERVTAHPSRAAAMGHTHKITHPTPIGPPPDRPRRGRRPVAPVRLVFQDQGAEDYTSWLKTDRKTLARINKLVEDVRRDPFTGIGKPEPLKYHLPGAWSRRIDDEHRLVYIVTEAEIIILAARYHY